MMTSSCSCHTLVYALIFSVFQLFLQKLSGEKLPYHSFQPPFEDVDATGDKIVPHWRTSGSTVVNKNFIRLTPDRQSKKGALWSRRALGVPDFSSILKFRISGQGKNFFGDGLALWITHTAFYNEGDLHGSEEKFFGVAIVFDTFKNTENLAAHRDVTVLVNDGQKTYDMMIEDSHDVVGCNTNIRYHAERGDFSVNDATRAKIVINGTSLIIQMDPRNKGDWMDCVKVDNLGLSEGWARSAYIGLTATTGQLADNHDVLSLQSYSDEKVMEMEEVALNDATPSLVLKNPASMEESISQLTTAINDLAKKLDTMDHHVEHKLVDVYDHIKTIVGKLEHKEENSEERIAMLETLVQKTVGQSVHPRLSSIETQMHGVVDRKFTNIEQALDRKLNNIVDEKTQVLQKSASSMQSWHIPFLLLLLLVIGAGVAMWLFYQKIRKMHLL